MTTPNFVKSEQRERIEAHLSAVKVGEKTPYEAIAAAGCVSIKELKDRGILYAAKQALEKNEHIVFGTITRFGLVRLDNPEVVDSIDNGMRRMRRASKRMASRLVQCVDYDALSREQQTKHNVRLAQVGVMYLISDKRSERRLKEYVNVSNEQLNMGQTLELLK